MQSTTLEDVGSRPSRRHRNLILVTCTYALVLVAGYLNVFAPLWGDQAAFIVGARIVDEGGVLYSDWWDFKQPGIILFYWLAEAVFGRGDSSARLLELAYWLGFATFVLAAMKPMLKSVESRCAAVAFSVGIYYLVATPWELAQLEMLTAFPLVVSWWIVRRQSMNGSFAPGLTVMAGVLGATVLLYKHAYFVAMLALWVAALHWPTQARPTRGERRRAALLLGAGTALPILAATVYFALVGGLDRAVWTNVVISFGTLDNGRPLSRLVRSSGWLVAMTLPVLVLAVYACRKGWKALDRRPYILDMTIWVVLGAVLLLAQYWWKYQQLFLLVPVALLGAMGVDLILANGLPRPKRVLAVALMTLCAVPFAAVSARKLVDAAQYRLYLSNESRERYQHDQENEYAIAEAQRDWLATQKPGSIHVFGNPLIQLRSGREQGISFHGWSPQYFDERIWAEFRAELESERPVLVAFESGFDDLVRTSSPATMRLVEQRYDQVRDDGAVTWWAWDDASN